MSHQASASAPSCATGSSRSAQAGHSRRAVLDRCAQAGWHEDVADRGAGRHAARLLDDTRKARRTCRRRCRCPSRTWTTSPLVLDAGDREVQVLQTMSNPRVVVFGDLLSDEECDELIERGRAAPGALADGRDQDRRRGGQRRPHQRRHVLRARRERAVRAHRAAHRRAAAAGRSRTARACRSCATGPAPSTGRTTTTSTRREPGTPTILQARRPARGHAGDVPAAARAGRRHHLPRRRPRGRAGARQRACSSATTGPHPATRTLHGGAPVLAGEKWVATKWLREGEFT